MTILCTMDCKYELLGECTKGIITISDMCQCEDYEEKTQEQLKLQYPDIFYAHIRNSTKDGFLWQKRRGSKLDWFGREIFIQPSGLYTDGRTGKALGYDLNKFPDTDMVLEKLNEIEKNEEISPLYNKNYTYPIELDIDLEDEE